MSISYGLATSRREVRKRLKKNNHRFWGRFHMFADDISERDLHNAEAYWIDLLRPQLNICPVSFK